MLRCQIFFIGRIIFCLCYVLIFLSRSNIKYSKKKKSFFFLSLKDALQFLFQCDLTVTKSKQIEDY